MSFGQASSPKSSATAASRFGTAINTAGPVSAALSGTEGSGSGTTPPSELATTTDSKAGTELEGVTVVDSKSSLPELTKDQQRAVRTQIHQILRDIKELQKKQYNRNLGIYVLQYFAATFTAGGVVQAFDGGRSPDLSGGGADAWAQAISGGIGSAFAGAFIFAVSVKGLFERFTNKEKHELLKQFNTATTFELPALMNISENEIFQYLGAESNEDFKIAFKELKTILTTALKSLEPGQANAVAKKLFISVFSAFLVFNGLLTGISLATKDSDTKSQYGYQAITLISTLLTYYGAAYKLGFPITWRPVVQATLGFGLSLAEIVQQELDPSATVATKIFYPSIAVLAGAAALPLIERAARCCFWKKAPTEAKGDEYHQLTNGDDTTNTATAAAPAQQQSPTNRK